MNYFTGIFMNYKMRQVEIEQLKIFSEQSIGINCARCGEPSVVPVLLGQDNRHICDRCGAENTIVISAEAALVTNPLESMVSIDKEELEKKLEEPRK